MKSLFLRNHSYDIKWWKIVLWWELRRVLFNLICLPTFYFLCSGISESSNAKAGGAPVFYLLGILFFIVSVNLYYTIFWITDIIIKLTNKGQVSVIQRYLFLISITTTIIGTYLMLEIFYA